MAMSGGAGDVVVQPIVISVIDGTVAIAGEIDRCTAPLLDQALTTTEEAARIDLSQVTFMDSSGVNALVRHYHRQADNGAAMQIVAMSRCVHRLLEITGLLRAFTGEVPLVASSSLD
jgi:anti-sigma B factor antagonist